MSERRVDASMSLLRSLFDEALDPDYARVAATPPKKSSRWSFAAVIVIVAVLFTIAAVQATRARPASTAERQELIARLADQKSAQDRLRSTIITRQEQVRVAERQALSRDAASSQLADNLEALEPVTGMVAVRGPGVRVTVDDGSGSTRAEQVVDTDLQQLANGLWQAGAEAISINGHRLTTTSAIREAGEAITVDYRSLTQPYVVEAIGNIGTLETRFRQTRAGAWWAQITQKHGLSFHLVAVSDDLVLPASPTKPMRYAEVTR